MKHSSERSIHTMNIKWIFSKNDINMYMTKKTKNKKPKLLNFNLNIIQSNASKQTGDDKVFDFRYNLSLS